MTFTKKWGGFARVRRQRFDPNRFRFSFPSGANLSGHCFLMAARVHCIVVDRSVLLPSPFNNRLLAMSPIGQVRSACDWESKSRRQRCPIRDGPDLRSDVS